MLAELRFAKALGTFATGRNCRRCLVLQAKRLPESSGDRAGGRKRFGPGYLSSQVHRAVGDPDHRWRNALLAGFEFLGLRMGPRGRGRTSVDANTRKRDGPLFGQVRTDRRRQATERPGPAALPVLVRPGVDGRRFLRIEARCTLTSGIDATNLSNVRLLYLAAHGGFAGQAVPLGGGAAVFNLLMAEWAKCAPFRVEAVTPAVIGAGAPTASDIAGFKEREYAQFCDAFREASTRRVLEEDPARVAVLVNDVSEGPDFARLARSGYRMSTIYHVDVVAYIARIYLRGLVAPWTLTRAWRASGSPGRESSRPTDPAAHLRAAGR